MSKPIIFAVESEAGARELIRQELQKRYAADYEIVCAETPTAGLETLEELQRAGAEIVLLLASCWLTEMDGERFLQKARALHPQARRALLMPHGDPTVAQAILHAAAMGTIDDYSPKPHVAADEQFHYVVTGLLREWTGEHRPAHVVAQIIGDHWARRSHELRDIFKRNSLPYEFYDVENAEGRSLLQETPYREGPLPVVVLSDGQVLSNPSNTELAKALDVSSVGDISGAPTAEVVDTVIVGAGPAGLSAAVYGASEGLRTVVVEREAIGGQAGMSSRIRNYLGFPMGISGGDLAARAYWQAWLFGTDFTFGPEAVGLEVRGDERVVFLSDGSELQTRTVVLAMGVSYRRLGIPVLDELIGAGVFYGAVGSEAAGMKGKNAYVLGAGNSAGQAALYLARYAEQVTMLVRGSSLAASMSEYLIKEIENTENVAVRPHTQLKDARGEYRLEQLILENKRTGETETVPAHGLFVHIGATPHTDWLPDTVKRDDDGYIVTGGDLLESENDGGGWPLERHPFLLETSIPGVFAAGDVRHRSLKRVASAVGEGSIAVTFIHQYLNQ